MPIENPGPCALLFVKDTSMDVPLFPKKKGLVMAVEEWHDWGGFVFLSVSVVLKAQINQQNLFSEL